jgi:hypothetical protein
MKYAVVALAVLATLGCSSKPDETSSNGTGPAPATSLATVNELKGWEGYPTAQPNGQPLTADYCAKEANKPDSPFDNTKTCLTIACDTGDKSSCEKAATFNGNMWPDQKPPDADIAMAEGKFTAISTTAYSITGDLTLSSGLFEFDLDQSYSVGNPRFVDASSAYSRSGRTWVDVLIVQPDAKVAIWPVIGQKIGPQGRSQSLCGQGDRVGFIATAEREGGLALAVFKGPSAPGPDATEDAICGTYFYDRAPGH